MTTEIEGRVPEHPGWTHPRLFAERLRTVLFGGRCLLLDDMDEFPDERKPWMKARYLVIALPDGRYISWHDSLAEAAAAFEEAARRLREEG